MQVEDIRDRQLRDQADAPPGADELSPAAFAAFWGTDSVFRPLFDQLDPAHVLHFASGRGRHSAPVAELAGQLTLVDPVPANVEACRERFAQAADVECKASNGVDLAECDSERYTAVFTYDAMCQYEATDVIGFLKEFARVLKPGGRALLHYSNNERLPEGTYRDDVPRWRSFFSEQMMRHFATRAGFRVLQSVTFPWPPHKVENPPEDALVLLEKVDNVGRPVTWPAVMRLSLVEAVDDAAASAAGVPYLGLYRSGNSVRIRVGP